VQGRVKRGVGVGRLSRAIAPRIQQRQRAPCSRFPLPPLLPQERPLGALTRP